MKIIFIPLAIVQIAAMAALTGNTLVSPSTVCIFMALILGISYCTYRSLEHTQ